VWAVPSLRAVGTRNHENLETALPERILFSSGLPSSRTGLYTVTANGWSERLENRAWGYSHAEGTAFGGANQPLGQRDDVLLFDALGAIAIDPITGTTRRTYPGAEGDRYHQVWTDPDKRFVLALSDSRISIWEYATAQPLREIPQGHERIARLLFDSKGSTLGIVSSDYTRAAAQFVGPGRNDLRMLRISRNSGEDLNAEATPRGLLVAQSGKRALKVMDLATNKVLLNRPGDFAYGPPVIAPDGASVMAGWFDRRRSKHKATAFSLDDGSSVFDVDAWGGPDHASPFSPDGHWLARPVYQAGSAHFNGYDWTTKKLHWSEPFGEELPAVVAMGAHGMLATRDAAREGPDILIRVSNIVDRRVVATFPRDQKDVVNLAIDDTAGVVAATTNNGHIIVFDMASGAELQRYDTKTELPLPALALSSRGIVAAGNERGQIYLYSIPKHRLVGQVELATLQNAFIVRTPEGQYEILIQDQADGRDVVCRSGNRTEPWARCAQGATPGLLARLLGS
jgi:hypothetical protein